MDYTVRLTQPGEQVLAKLIDALRCQGLQVKADCDCPYHGLMECTCQYAILLIYDPQQLDGTYRTTTIHGRDETVWLTLLQSPVPYNGTALAHEAVEAIILDALLSLVAPVQEIKRAKIDALGDLEQ
jgi:hypothetical protein